MYACLYIYALKYAHACVYVWENGAGGEVEHESDSKHSPLSVIKLHSCYVAV